MDHYNGKCHYERCWVPKNNHKYLCQMVVIALSVLVLFISEKSFTFFPLLLVVAPVMIDVIFTEVRAKALNVVRVFFVVLNVALILGGILGLVGILVDDGKYFSIPETYMFFPGLTIEKKYIGIAVLSDIIVPFILWIGAPCQEALCIVEKNSLKREEDLNRQEVEKE